MGAPGATVRVQAAQVLDAVAHRGTSLKAALATALPTLADPRDRALLEAICFGALRGAARYDRALAAWIPRPLPRRDAALRALLHVGFAQLDPLGLPAHAALSATVEAARAMGRSHQAGLVNALLRRAQRDGLPPPAPGDGWPAWLLAQVRKDWPDAWEAILAASASQAPTWLRVNRRRSTPAACIAALAEAGVEAVAVPGLPDALRVDAPFAVAALPGFTDGLFSVQDGSAQQVAAALAPAPGARVLDACAAPGGKSAHLVERDPALRLTALDVAAPRVARIAATFARLGVGEQASLRTVDALEVGRWWDGTPFDAVLLDAPCSATGVVRRQPDVLLHRRASDLEALVALQSRLLDALAPTVAPGGVLLYATCSILRRENAAQVEAFLARHPDFAVQRLDAGFGRDTGAGHQRLPGEDGMDGFFYARLRRGR